MAGGCGAVSGALRIFFEYSLFEVDRNVTCRTVTYSVGIVPLRLTVPKRCDVFEQSGAGNARPKLATKPHMLQCNY